MGTAWIKTSEDRKIDYEYRKQGLRQCIYCGGVKSLEEFYKAKANIGGRMYECKSCHLIRVRERDESGFNLTHRSAVRRKYKLNSYECAELLEKQNCKCAICMQDISFSDGSAHIDHNHVTGKVRGVLCGNCNRGIGIFKENPASLQRAMEYLSEKENVSGQTQ